MHEEEVLGKAYDGKLMKRLIHYLRPYKWYVVLGIVLSIVVSALEAVRPVLYEDCRRRQHQESRRARVAGNGVDVFGCPHASRRHAVF